MTAYFGQNLLVTGANRGLGLSFVQYILKDYPEVKRLFAGCRDPEKATGLQELKKQHDSRLHLIKLDVTSDQSIQQAFEQVQKELQSEGLDVLINNAGISLWESHSTSKPDRDTILKIFNVNVAGVAMITATFLPLLNKSAQANKRPSKVMNLSSHLGSRPLNNGFVVNGDFAYASSKAALNMYSHLLAKHEKQIVVLSMDPGHVQTDLGGKQAPLTVDDSVPQMLKVLGNADLKQSGQFIDYTGAILPA